jgi:hypothetical protein
MHYFIAEVPIPDHDGVRTTEQRVYIKSSTPNITLADVKAMCEKFHERDKSSPMYDHCWEKCLESIRGAEGDIKLYAGVASINTFTTVKLPRGLVSQKRCPLALRHIDFQDKESARTQSMPAAQCTSPYCDNATCPTHGIAPRGDDR